MTTTTPTVSNVKRHAGIAGQFSISATVQHDGEPADTITFVGSVHGGPIVMVLPSGAQTFVSTGVTDRIGSTLSESWVRAFFA